MIEGDYFKRYKINRRLLLLMLLKVLGFVIVFSRLIFLQLFQYKKYQLLSNKNRIRVLSITPPRGLIFDSNNILLASNIYDYKVILDKKISLNYKQTLDKLFHILKTPNQLREEKLEEILSYSSNLITIFNRISWHEVSLIEENSNSLSGIYITHCYNRKYLFPYLSSHIIGYLSSDNFSRQIGVYGVEKVLESSLKGVPGYKEIEVNSKGKFIKNINITEPIKGEDVKLSINIDLQNKISQIWGNNKGSLILRETKTGKIRSIISTPSFDNNMFSNPISSRKWQSLSQNKNFSLINRSIQALYPPGSLFKIIVILAAIENNISPDFVVVCSNQPYLKKTFRCNNLLGHGAINMQEAIYKSCNNYIYTIAEKIGWKAIIKMVKKFQLDELSGLEDLGREIKSCIPSDVWKKKIIKENWYLGDTLNLSIGQGYLGLTPIILNNLISAIANEGIIIKPTINENKITLKDTIDINVNNILFLKEALYKVVNQYGGTAYKNRVNINGHTMSGKTGTSQVISKSSRKYRKYIKDHALFLGFFPSYNPLYSISVVIENGGSGGKKAAHMAKQAFSLLGKNI